MPIHLADETSLVNDARHGDPEAFGVLVNQYRNHLYRLSLRITGNAEDAEDALQDALLKAYCNLEYFRGNSRFYTWMVRITLNQALMKLRQRRRQKQVLLADLEPLDHEGQAWPEAEDPGPNPEQQCASGELEQIISRGLHHLGPRLSSVFILRHVDGFSAAELTQMLGLSLPAVKSRLLRARTRLRKRLLRTWAGVTVSRPIKKASSVLLN
jgi:RNA polymerase sigma-70 factor (ECF subfamily)